MAYNTSIYMNHTLRTLRSVSLWMYLICCCISCTSNPFKNPFIDESLIQVYPDTVVTINSITPQVCDVTIKSTDSTYHITKYWTDANTGRILYKMEDKPFKDNRLHGVEYKYSPLGDTLLVAHFDNGIRVDSTIYRWDNGNSKHKYYYSDKMDGNVIFEIQYHENGLKKTDIVAYENGQINGAVDYYDDSPQNKRSETFYYREGELIGIKIYNDLYNELDRTTASMLAKYRQDSARLAEELAQITLSTEQSNEIAVYYIGTERDAMYDIGTADTFDIMKIDPKFMLRYYNR